MFSKKLYSIFLFTIVYIKNTLLPSVQFLNPNIYLFLYGFYLNRIFSYQPMSYSLFGETFFLGGGLTTVTTAETANNVLFCYLIYNIFVDVVVLFSLFNVLFSFLLSLQIVKKCFKVQSWLVTLTNPPVKQIAKDLYIKPK